jgi:hypothetical protein
VVATHEEEICELADVTWRMAGGTLAFDSSPAVREGTAIGLDWRRGSARDVR